jgi:hypothetical protein
MQRYISNELSHFIGRGLPEPDQYGLLIEIVKTGWLTPPPHSLNMDGNLQIKLGANFSSNEMYCPEAVCFCDIPVQDLPFHSAKYSHFGISFSKDSLIKKGAAPVFYLPMHAPVETRRAFVPEEGPWPTTHQESRECIPLGTYFDRMVNEFRALMEQFYQETLSDLPRSSLPMDSGRILELERFFDFHIFSFIKFFDHTLPETDPNNFYYEREWRIVGNLPFSVDEVSRILLPPSYARRLRTDLTEYTGQVSFM